jgi:hypothetical protein
MNLLESQNILLGVLKFLGFFPIDFPGKYRKFKNHLYNFLVSATLILTFTIVGVSHLNLSLVNTTEKDSFLGYLAALMIIIFSIFCFVIIKLYLLVKSDVQEKYFEALRNLEITVRNYHVKNTKIKWMIQELRKSTLRQEITIFSIYIFLQCGFAYFGGKGNILMYIFREMLYDIFNCFFNQILIFLKVNMSIARRLQNHLNQVLLSLQKSDKQYNVEDFIEIHQKIKNCLKALNEAFGFVFLMAFVAVYGSMVPEIYKSMLTLLQSDFNVPMNRFIYIVLCIMWAFLGYYYLGKFAFECDEMGHEVIFR